MSCCERRRMVTDLGFKVCMSCGVQGRIIFIKPSIYGRAPGRPPYSRRKRFLKLLYNVWGARLPKLANDFMKQISAEGPVSPRDIIKFMKVQKDRTFKRYDCVAKLSQQLLGHRPEPICPRKVAFCLGQFQRIEIRHCRICGVFPAYSFILEMCLQHPIVNRPDLIQYLHILKCPKRREKYRINYFSS